MIFRWLVSLLRVFNPELRPRCAAKGEVVGYEPTIGVAYRCPWCKDRFVFFVD